MKENEMNTDKLAEIKAAHNTPNRNAEGKLIFSDDLHLADEHRATLIGMNETQSKRITALLNNARTLLERAESAERERDALLKRDTGNLNRLIEAQRVIGEIDDLIDEQFIATKEALDARLILPAGKILLNALCNSIQQIIQEQDDG